MINISLELLIEYLGQPRKKQGDEYIWQCPLCQDRGKDNLKFNVAKGVLYCFADNNHSKTILSDMNKKFNGICPKSQNNVIKPVTNSVKITSEQISNYENYMYKCNENLVFDKTLLELAFTKRGLKHITISCTKMGYDKYKQVWTIPTFKYDCREQKVIGFEFRPHDFSKNGLYRTKGTPNCLATINAYYPEIEALCVVEGYLDAYLLLQYLIEIKQDRYFHIVTPSNGVNSLVKHLQDIDFSKYKKFYIAIDNDDAGNKAKAEILKKYPFFHTIDLKDCKDFNEYYLKYLMEVK